MSPILNFICPGFITYSFSFNNHFTTQQIGLMYMYRDAKLSFAFGGMFQMYNMTGQQEIPKRDPVTFKMNNILLKCMCQLKQG